MSNNYPEQRLIAAANAINSIGPDALSEKIFSENIAPGHEKLARRCISLARYAAAVSPTRNRCDWYTVAMFSGAVDLLMPDGGGIAYTEHLLQSIGIPRKFISAIWEANSNKAASEISPLALAIRFSDMHIDDEGYLVKTKDGIREIKADDTTGVEKELMRICCELTHLGEYDKWVSALDKLISKGGSYGGQEEIPEPKTEKVCATS